MDSLLRQTTAPREHTTSDHLGTYIHTPTGRGGMQSFAGVAAEYWAVSFCSSAPFSSVETNPVEVNDESACVFFYRYRKVVGDMCNDLLGSQFLAGHVPCPPVVPEGLGMQIEGGPSAVFLSNRNITFVITQQLVRLSHNTHQQNPQFADSRC